MKDDNIANYTQTVADGFRGYCPSCACERPVWGGVTVSGDELRCCGFCQRVLSRKPAERAGA
jgi:hypothetical protein